MHKGPGWACRRRVDQFLGLSSTTLEQKKDIQRGNMRNGWVERFDISAGLLCYYHIETPLLAQWNFPCLSGSDAPAAQQPNRPPRIIHRNGPIANAIAVHVPPAPVVQPRILNGETPIPEGWSRFFCARENAYYFFHPRTGVTQWENPTPSQSL